MWWGANLPLPPPTKSLNLPSPKIFQLHPVLDILTLKDAMIELFSYNNPTCTDLP